MSHQLSENEIKFIQRCLKFSGFDPGEINGIWGSSTDSAKKAFIIASEEIANTYGTFDQQSEKAIFTLHPKAQKTARQFLKRLRDAGINARIISGTRTYEKQNEIFNNGRNVTGAKGGQSFHNFGIAWDIGIFTNDGEYLKESPLYDKAAQVGLTADLEWGGNWINFRDRPHYQLHINIDLSNEKERDQARKRFEDGELSL